MSSYTKARHLKIGGGLYRIVAEEPTGMWFYFGNPAEGRGILVPQGFITDGPSIPPWLRTWLRLIGLYGWVLECLLKASAVHDRMREDRQFSLLEADCYFLIALKADQKNWKGPKLACDVLRELAFLGVRTNRSRRVWNSEVPSVATS